MESYARFFIADLPRAGGLTDGARGTRRPTTTPVSSASNLLADPTFAALSHQMQQLEEALAALTRENRVLDYDAAHSCHEGLEGADNLLVASANIDTKYTIWKLCHLYKYSKKCDIARRHIRIAQHTYETVDKRFQDTVRHLTELCEKAKSLEHDAELLSGSINEANFRQGRENPIVNFRIGSGLDAWSRAALTPAAAREDDRVTRATRPTSMRTEIFQNVLRQAGSEPFQQGSGATRKAEISLVLNLILRMELFRANRSKFSHELRGRETTLQAAGDRCRGIVARLDALQESSFEDMVIGVQNLASGILVERHRKRKEERRRRESIERRESRPGGHTRPSLALWHFGRDLRQGRERR